MAENKVQITIEAVDKAKAALQNLQNDLKGIQTEGGKLPAVFSSMRAGIVAFSAAAAGIAGVAAAMRSFVNEAAEAEEIENRLKYALQSLGYSWDQAKDSVDKYADSVAETTRFSDEEARKALTDMLMYTRDIAKAQDASRLAMDMSVRTGQDLASSTRLIGMALSGNVEMLGRYIPEFRNLDAVLGENATSAQKAEYALRILREKFGGTASEDLKTYAGTVKQFDKAWKDFSETIGRVLLPPLKDLFSWLTKVVKKMEEVASGRAFQGKGLQGDLKTLETQIDLYEKYLAQAEKAKPGSPYRLGPEAMQDARAKLAEMKAEREKIKADIAWVEEQEKDGQIKSIPDLPVPSAFEKKLANKAMEDYLDSLRIYLEEEQNLQNQIAKMEAERISSSRRADEQNQEQRIENEGKALDEYLDLLNQRDIAHAASVKARFALEEKARMDDAESLGIAFENELKERSETARKIAEENKRIRAEQEKSWKDMADVLSGSLEAGFFDLFKGGIKDLKSLWDDFCNSLVQSFSRAMAKMATNYLLFGNTKGESSGDGGIFGLFKGLFSGGGGLFGGGGGGLGLFESFFGGNIGVGGSFVPFMTPGDFFHKGGVVGVVPRFHSGLSSDEYPAILQSGEGVLSRKGMAALGALNSGESGGGGSVLINIMAADAQSFTDMCRRNPQAILGPLMESLKRSGPVRYAIQEAT